MFSTKKIIDAARTRRSSSYDDWEASFASASLIFWETAFLNFSSSLYFSLLVAPTGSIYNHACVMRRVLDLGLPILPVGIRSLCLEEAELIKQQQIPVVWAKDIYRQPNWIEKAISHITTDKVFITIDLDGLDSSLMPGVGTPEPGGLNWYEITKFLRSLFTKHRVIGCDVMELAPTSDSVVSEFIAAKLVYKLIGYSVLD